MKGWIFPPTLMRCWVPTCLHFGRADRRSRSISTLQGHWIITATELGAGLEWGVCQGKEMQIPVNVVWMILHVEVCWKQPCIPGLRTGAGCGDCADPWGSSSMVLKPVILVGPGGRLQGMCGILLSSKVLSQLHPSLGPTSTRWCLGSRTSCPEAPGGSWIAGWGPTSTTGIDLKRRNFVNERCWLCRFCLYVLF